MRKGVSGKARNGVVTMETLRYILITEEQKGTLGNL